MRERKWDNNEKGRIQSSAKRQVIQGQDLIWQTLRKEDKKVGWGWVRIHMRIAAIIGAQAESGQPRGGRLRDWPRWGFDILRCPTLSAMPVITGVWEKSDGRGAPREWPGWKNWAIRWHAVAVRIRRGIGNCYACRSSVKWARNGTKYKKRVCFKAVYWSLIPRWPLLSESYFTFHARFTGLQSHLQPD